MNIQDVKHRLAELLIQLDTENPGIDPVEFLKENFLTINEAVIYADSHGVKLTNHPVQQFHHLCKTGKMESAEIGEKNTRLITKRSLDKWIVETKKKTGEGVTPSPVVVYPFTA